eukprot:2466342-Prymnesium_polylepis.1
MRLLALRRSHGRGLRRGLPRAHALGLARRALPPRGTPQNAAAQSIGVRVASGIAVRVAAVRVAAASGRRRDRARVANWTAARVSAVREAAVRVAAACHRAQHAELYRVAPDETDERARRHVDELEQERAEAQRARLRRPRARRVGFALELQ